MSRNYDNWERLVAAVVKREQIWQLCHQDSISTICASDYSSDLETEADDFELVLINYKHENVETPWACRFSEKIIYSDYSQGSVYDMFQGNGSRPDWESRVRIAVGVGRGIAHMHAQFGGKQAHGNIKSSNIFVNTQGQQYGIGLACIRGEGVQTKWWENHASEQEFDNPSQKSDVYSFGMLLLELVTGSSSLVNSSYIVYRLRLSDPDTLNFNGCCLFVDEMDMERDKFPFVDPNLDSSSVELRKMLKVAKICLDELPEHRPTMSQVLFQLQQRSRQHPIPIVISLPRKSGSKKALNWNRIFRYRR